jgi:hypothetical protein
MLDSLNALPGPQRDALRTVFGLAAGATPKRFQVGLAVLWLDRASAPAMAFAACRLLVESVVVLFAAREPGAELGGLPRLEISSRGKLDQAGTMGWQSED